MKRLSHILVSVLAAATLILIASSAAEASHYDLEDVDLVSEDARTKLSVIGVDDTRQLLARLATPEGRADTAAATGLTSDEIDALAKQLELMQIVGIGPRASRLLLASGIDSANLLAGSDADQLVEKLVATNAEHQYTGVDPDTEVVSDWIEKAAKVEITLQ